ncbi:MAG: hypothetical protein ACC618_01400 [Patescibacteria group bacterium]
MEKLVKTIYIVFAFSLFLYLFIPNPSFPKPPKDALRSNEPADTESLVRRAYFTNYTREEVMNYYSNNFKLPGFLNISTPTYRLNYPPEEAQTIIREQTRSTFLEEIVHPFRESLFVSGFEPKDPKDAIEIEGKIWRQKITVRLVQSTLLSRFLVATLTLIVIAIIYVGYTSLLKKRNG